jgi:hypothetical protein
LIIVFFVHADKCRAEASCADCAELQHDYLFCQLQQVTVHILTLTAKSVVHILGIPLPPDSKKLAASAMGSQILSPGPACKVHTALHCQFSKIERTHESLQLHGQLEAACHIAEAWRRHSFLSRQFKRAIHGSHVLRRRKQAGGHCVVSVSWQPLKVDRRSLIQSVQRTPLIAEHFTASFSTRRWASGLTPVMLRGSIKRSRLVQVCAQKEGSKDAEAKGTANGIATPQFFQRPSFWVQSALILATLAYIDAAFSGDWSRIGVLSKETEANLRIGAYLVVPLTLASAWWLGKVLKKYGSPRSR